MARAAILSATLSAFLLTFPLAGPPLLWGPKNVFHRGSNPVSADVSQSLNAGVQIRSSSMPNEYFRAFS
jgi:hypothetical protein